MPQENLDLGSLSNSNRSPNLPDCRRYAKLPHPHKCHTSWRHSGEEVALKISTGSPLKCCMVRRSSILFSSVIRITNNKPVAHACSQQERYWCRWWSGTGLGRLMLGWLSDGQCCQALVGFSWLVVVSFSLSHRFSCRLNTSDGAVAKPCSHGCRWLSNGESDLAL